MMTMMMVVVMVREYASIFINRRRWRLVICLTFIRIFSKDTLMMMVVIVGERRSRLFTIDDPLVWLIHFSSAFLRMIHSTTALPIVCISRIEHVYEHHQLRLYHDGRAQPCVPHKFSHIIIIFLQELLCFHINSHMIYHLFLQLSIKWPKSNEPWFKGLKAVLCA